MSTLIKLPPTIERYKRLTDNGTVVNIPLVCYHSSCTDNPIMAALVREDGQPHLYFNGAERIHWNPEKCTALIFLLKEHVRCPNCGAEFVQAIVIEGLQGAKIIGYEAESC